ncbi:MAG: deoxycytidine triphosphate deaminase [Gemmatimonadetes bacterium]|nr:deoxycytidine triphosphate deaminase [Gemmatimonadota bacterium]NIR79045.1 deoxycytidine triphosphate deaminase [Gemmatimonadota bacterium]NIT87702.1 deoxycytidine triphosphate deaminase [Gemmatimonadota bacterium]NIU31563.1 deoxycytidine triphosphate deaminase [Gemmatimonadota bacterium]NIU36219.1 deoxycytidine triphosphate deaminase [Gemmatimonadota bacterium]
MTRILDPDDTRSTVGGLVHLDTQRAAVGIDLTVGGVFRLTGPGSLDFGGSELESADRRRVEPRPRSEDDDYGWWELEPGSYVVRYNETLDPGDGELAVVFPLERLLLAGASHPAFLADGPRDPLEALLSVGDAGCRIKENARVSRGIVLESS